MPTARQNLYRSTIRYASRVLCEYDLGRYDDTHVEGINDHAAATFGVTYSASINGDIADHEELIQRMFHRLINLDQDLEDTEDGESNIHASDRGTWPVDMLQSALHLSLPKADAKIRKMLDAYQF